MKKFALFAAMLAAILAVCALDRTNRLSMLPLTTPQAFLAGMPYTRLAFWGREWILIQPSSTVLVYALGFLMLAIGVTFLVTRRGERSREYWGIGLILWGLSALAAGTSYQAFGYELKCRGQLNCLFTSDFELAYLLLTAYSINFLVAASAFTSAGEKGRRGLLRFALLDSLAYSLYLGIGAVLPLRFLVSYEGFIAFIGINFVIMFVFSLRHFLRHKDLLNRRLVLLWLGFLLVNLGYFAALFGGLGPGLYEKYGIWFNENDVLHVLLIGWALAVFLALRKSLRDRPAAAGTNA